MTPNPSVNRTSRIKAARGWLPQTLAHMTSTHPKRLSPFRGRLSADELAHGIMNIANANAQRLAEDAQTLITAGRIPTAASLAALSIEESGKVSVFRQLATSTTDADVKAAWKSYRTHTRKNAQWLLPELALKGARKLDDLSPLFGEDADHPFILDNLKQLGFYTDCLENKKWSIPQEAIDEKLARGLVQTAKLLVGKRHVTVKEIELWIEHLGPIPKGDLMASKTALAKWYSAMQDAGLYEPGVNRMEQFINEGVPSPKG